MGLVWNKFGNVSRVWHFLCFRCVNFMNALQQNARHLTTVQDVAIPGDGFTIGHYRHILSGKINNRFILSLATRIDHNFVSCLSGCTIFFTLRCEHHYFRETRNWTEVCVLILSTTFVGNVSLSKRNWSRYIQKCIFLFVSHFKETWNFFRQIFEKRGRTDGGTDRRTEDMRKRIVIFRNIAKVPKKIVTNRNHAHTAVFICDVCYIKIRMF